MESNNQLSSNITASIKLTRLPVLDKPFPDDDVLKSLWNCLSSLNFFVFFHSCKAIGDFMYEKGSGNNLLNYSFYMHCQNHKTLDALRSIEVPDIDYYVHLWLQRCFVHVSFPAEWMFL